MKQEIEELQESTAKQLEEKDKEMKLLKKTVTKKTHQLKMVERTYEEVLKKTNLYIFSSDKPNYFKVGMSIETKNRKKPIQGAHIDDTKTIFEYKCSHDVILEKVVHYVLSKYRACRREFFHCNSEYIQNIIKIVGCVVDTCASSYENIHVEDLVFKVMEKLLIATNSKSITVQQKQKRIDKKVITLNQDGTLKTRGQESSSVLFIIPKNIQDLWKFYTDNLESFIVINDNSICLKKSVGWKTTKCKKSWHAYRPLILDVLYLHQKLDMSKDDILQKMNLLWDKTNNSLYQFCSCISYVIRERLNLGSTADTDRISKEILENFIKNYTEAFDVPLQATEVLK
jgi:hypothetical protein